jgi:hypothetical protein
MKKIIILTTLLIITLLGKLSAQNQPNTIEISLRNNSQGILIRWMPGNAVLWEQGILNGYQLRRTELLNGNPVSGTTTVLNGGQNIKPSTNSAVWDALYASADSVEAYSLNSDLEYMLTESSLTSEDKEELFFVNLLTADVSYNSALAMGLGYSDNTADPLKTYKYEVTCGTVTGVEVSPPYFVIPPHKIRNIFEQDGEVNLNWRDDTLQTAYFMKYYVQRSVSGGPFITLNEAPIVYMESSSIDSSGQEFLAPTLEDILVFNDSAAVQGVINTYRLEAHTLFGEITVSPTVQIMVKRYVSFKPVVTRSELNASGNLCLDWAYPADTLLPAALNDISGFLVQESRTGTEPYTNLIPIGSSVPLINKLDTSACFADMIHKGFQRVCVVVIGGDTLCSPNIYTAPVDSIPPHPPVNVTAVMDESGLVTISWEPDPRDNDVKHYKVLRANLADEEPVEISSHRINDSTAVYFLDTTTFVDTLANQNPDSRSFYSIDNPEAYYYIIALDGNDNQSEASEPAILTKPDKTAPDAPIIVSFTVSGNSVTLNWDKSISTDVVSHMVSKARITDLAASPPFSWSTVITLSDTSSVSTYTDNSISSEGYYVYAISAADAAGNTSVSNFIIADISRLQKFRSEFTTFDATFDQEQENVAISWLYSNSDLVEYQLYRSSGLNTNPSLWKVLRPGESSFNDYTFEYDESYTYGIKAVFSDGTSTNLIKKTITVPPKRFITISSNYTLLPFTSSDSSFTISSNIAWNIQNIPGWLSVSPVSGSGSATINYSASTNPDSVERTAILKIVTALGERYVDIYQEHEEIGTGILARYYQGFTSGNFNSIDESNPQIKRLEPTVNLDHVMTARPAGLSWNFTTVWSGFLTVPADANYKFHTNLDGGFRLFINDSLVSGHHFSDWQGYFDDRNSGDVYLKYGEKHKIRVEFWDDWGVPGLKLQWSNNAGMTRRSIETRYLFPDDVYDSESEDPLAGKCFYLRGEFSGQYLQALLNFSIRPRPFSGLKDQMWKVEKLDSGGYKIMSLMDKQKKIIQSIDTTFQTRDLVTLGYFSGAKNQKLNMINDYENRYQILIHGTPFNIIELDEWPEDKKLTLFSYASYFYRFEHIGCPVEDTKIETSVTEIILAPGGSSTSFNLKTGLGWILEQSSPWFNASEYAGYGSKQITVSATANTTGTIRYGLITIKSENGNRTIRVIQNPD